MSAFVGVRGGSPGWKAVTLVVSVVAATLGVMPASTAQAAVAASYPAGTGPIPIHEFKSFGVTDRSSLNVNLATGNLMFTSTDFRAGSLAVERSWNSLAPNAGQGEMLYGWALNHGSDTWLQDCDSTGPQAAMPGQLRFKFTKQPDGRYASPTGLQDLDLTRTGGSGCADDTWVATSRANKSALSFGGPSYAEPYRRYLTQVVDGSGNRIQVDYGTVDEQQCDGGGVYGGVGGGDGGDYCEYHAYIKTVSVFDVMRNRRVTYLHSVDGKRITGLQDWGGRTARYELDPYLRVVSSTDLAGKVTRYGYGAGNLITSITDPAGRVITVDYDASRRVTSVSRGGLTWSFKYDNGADGDWRPACNGAQTDLWEPGLAYRSRYCFDGEGRMVTERRGDVESTTQQFDGNSNVTRAGWLNSQVAATYDSSSRLLSTSDATGAKSSFSYGDAVNPFLATSATNPQGFTYGIGYDSAGRTTRITDPAANVQAFRYNGNGTLASSSDQLDRVTAYGYDAAGKATSVDPPGTAIGTSSYTYDGFDRVATTGDGKGQLTGFDYDAMDRVVRASYADGTFLSYTYDGVGNLTSRYDSTRDAVTTYSYDSLNRLVTETAPGEAGITYGYDAASRLESYTDGGGTTRYAYGFGSLLTRVTEPNGAVTRYQIETAPGAAESYHPPFPPKIFYPNGVTVQNDPDLAGRLRVTRATTSDGRTLLHREYGYNRPDTTVSSTLLQTETDYVANTVTAFTYDPVDRLTRASTTNRSTGAVVSDYIYGYDQAGNRTSSRVGTTVVSETSNEENQLKTTTAGGSTSTYGHDANGNLTSSSAGFSASYNAKNQATAIKGLSGSTLAAAYDGMGQTELRQLGAETLTNSALGVSRVGGDRFTRGPDGRLVSMRTAEGATHYYLTDIRGSVVGLTSTPVSYGGDPPMPDTTGGGVDGGVYADSGSGPVSLTAFAYNGPAGIAGPQSGDAAALRNPFRFTGELYSSELRLYKIGERWYDPELGRWTQADPIPQPYSPRESNRYGYAGADPVNFADPTGLSVRGGLRGLKTLCEILLALCGPPINEGGGNVPSQPLKPRPTQEDTQRGRPSGRPRPSPSGTPPPPGGASPPAAAPAPAPQAPATAPAPAPQAPATAPSTGGGVGGGGGGAMPGCA